MRLDRYELMRPIARGGMADVWLARLSGKHGFEKTFAIKTIRAEALCLSPLDLSAPDALSPQTVPTAVAAVLKRCGGEAGVDSDFAFEYGEHPDLTIARLRLAQAVVDTTTSDGSPR